MRTHGLKKMPETARDQLWHNGVLVSDTPRVVSDQEIERRDMPTLIRVRLPQLRAWSNDAQDVAALTAMTAAQRLQRQAVIEDRVAKMARLLMGLAWQIGQDDGS